MAIPPSEYDEEFVLASFNTFTNNLEVIDNVILNELANQKLGPHQPIKKRAEYKRTTINTSKPDLNKHSFKKFRKRSIANTKTRSVLLKSF